MYINTCAHCGEKLEAGKPFCASCGTAVDPSTAEHNKSRETTEAHRKVQRRHGGMWALGFSVLLVVASLFVGMVIIHEQQESQKEALEATKQREARLYEIKKPYNALLAIQSACEIGVNYNNYTRHLIDAAAVLKAFEPLDAEEKIIKTSLQSALMAYKTARDAWATSFSDDPWKAMLDFREEHEEEIENHQGSFPYEVDEILQLYWRKARVALLSAKVKIDIYRAPGGS